MKWAQLYSDLLLVHETADKSIYFYEALNSMADAETFRFALGHYDKTAGTHLNYRGYMSAKITKIEVVKTELQITIVTRGILPPGIKHGTYTLTMTDPDTFVFLELPAEMFEEGNVDFSNVDELWKIGALEMPELEGKSVRELLFEESTLLRSI